MLQLDDWVLCRIYKKADRSPLKINEKKVEDHNQHQHHHHHHEHHAKKSIRDPTTLIPSSSSHDQDHNEALIPSSSTQNNNNNNDTNELPCMELQRINIHQNPTFMEQPHPPPIYNFQHHPGLTNPGLTMDHENAFKGLLEPLMSSSTYPSAEIKTEDYNASIGYHYHHDHDAYASTPSNLFYSFAIPSNNLDASLDHSVMKMDNTDNVMNSFSHFSYGNHDFYNSHNGLGNDVFKPL